MGKRTEVDTIRDDLMRRIDSAEKLVNSVRLHAAVKNAGQGKSLHVKHVYKVVELAFMDMCAQWEDFLERSVVRYLAGSKTKSGKSPTLRLSKCANLTHAYQVLTGTPHFNPASEFLSWTSPSAVIDRVKVFFANGSPYATSVNKCKLELERAFKLRNRIAHSSAKCIKEFKVAANHYLSPSNVKQGYRVGQLLGERHQHDFAFLPAPTAGIAKDYFTAHAEMFRMLAKEIVPYNKL
jgi:hypothetical protein